MGDTFTEEIWMAKRWSLCRVKNTIVMRSTRSSRRP